LHHTGQGLARLSPAKQIEGYAFRASVDDAVDTQPLHGSGLLDLPGAGSADDHFRAVLPDRRVQIDALALGGVDGPRGAAENIAVNARGKRRADRVMRADAHRDGFGADELVQIVRVADGHVIRGIVLQQDLFHDPNTVGNHDGGTVGILRLLELILVEKAGHVAGRGRRVNHLLPRAKSLLRAFRIWCGENKLHPTRIVRHTPPPKTFDCTVF
jgi:hypothetical protein